MSIFHVSQLRPRPLCQAESILVVLGFVELLSLQLLPTWPQLLVSMTSSIKFCLLGFLTFHT